MTVLAVFAADSVIVHHGDLRDRCEQFKKLLDEWLVQIDVSSVRQWIEAVTPPTLQAVDGIGGIGCMHRDDRLIATTATAVLECVFPAPDHASLEATIGAEFWGRDRICLPYKHRGDFRVEGQIILSDLKCS